MSTDKKEAAKKPPRTISDSPKDKKRKAPASESVESVSTQQKFLPLASALSNQRTRDLLQALTDVLFSPVDYQTKQGEINALPTEYENTSLPICVCKARQEAIRDKMLQNLLVAIKKENAHKAS